MREVRGEEGGACAADVAVSFVHLRPGAPRAHLYGAAWWFSVAGTGRERPVG